MHDFPFYCSMGRSKCGTCGRWGRDRCVCANGALTSLMSKSTSKKPKQNPPKASSASSSAPSQMIAACCHPRLLVRRLKRCELWDSHQFPMLDRFMDNYKSWRQCVANYMETSVDKAKTELIRSCYGGKPSVRAQAVR